MTENNDSNRGIETSRWSALHKLIKLEKVRRDPQLPAETGHIKWHHNYDLFSSLEEGLAQW